MIIWVGGFKFQSSSESRPKGTARLVSSYLPSKSSSPVVMEFRPSIIRQNPVINPVRRLDPNFASLSFIGLGRGSMAHCRPSPIRARVFIRAIKIQHQVSSNFKFACYGLLFLLGQPRAIPVIRIFIPRTGPGRPGSSSRTFHCRISTSVVHL